MPEETMVTPRATASRVAALASAALLLLVGSLVVQAKPDNWNAPAGPVFAYVIRGAVRNKLTGERLANARVSCGGRTDFTDSRGRFAVQPQALGSGICQIEADGFETQKVTADSGQMMGIELTPDPISTLSLIIAWEQQGQFGWQYDLLHPDVRRSWTREEFVRLLSLTEHDRVTAAKHASPYALKHWDYYGQIYDDAVVVPTWVSLKRDGHLVRLFWEAHLVKVNGLWYWFREPGAEIQGSD